MTRSASNVAELLGGLLIACLGLAFLSVGVAGALAEGGWLRLLLALGAIAAAAVTGHGVRTIVRSLRVDPTEQRHQDLMRAAVGLPPEPAWQPPPLPGHAPATPAAPVAAADVPAALAAPRVRVDAAADAEPVPRPAHAAAEAGPVPRPAAGERTLPSGEPILAYWTYPAEEWRAYTAGEWRYRVWEAVGLAVLIGLVGGVLATLRSGQPEYGSTLAFGGLIGVLRLAVADSRRRANAAGPGYAIISPTAVLLNGTHHPLVSERLHFGGVWYAGLDQPPVLVFTVKWKMRDGWNNEQIRVPVPAGREQEAGEVVAAFERGWAVETSPKRN